MKINANAHYKELKCNAPGLCIHPILVQEYFDAARNLIETQTQSGSFEGSVNPLDALQSLGDVKSIKGPLGRLAMSSWVDSVSLACAEQLARGLAQTYRDDPSLGATGGEQAAGYITADAAPRLKNTMALITEAFLDLGSIDESMAQKFLDQTVLLTGVSGVLKGTDLVEEEGFSAYAKANPSITTDKGIVNLTQKARALLAHGLVFDALGLADDKDGQVQILSEQSLAQLDLSSSPELASAQKIRASVLAATTGQNLLNMPVVADGERPVEAQMGTLLQNVYGIHKTQSGTRLAPRLGIYALPVAALDVIVLPAKYFSPKKPICNWGTISVINEDWLLGAFTGKKTKMPIGGIGGGSEASANAAGVPQTDAFNMLEYILPYTPGLLLARRAAYLMSLPFDAQNMMQQCVFHENKGASVVETVRDFLENSQVSKLMLQDDEFAVKGILKVAGFTWQNTTEDPGAVFKEIYTLLKMADQEGGPLSLPKEQPKPMDKKSPVVFEGKLNRKEFLKNIAQRRVVDISMEPIENLGPKNS